MDFVCIDFETANNNLASACSVGIVGVKDNKISDTYYSLIKPKNLYFNSKNIEIHGITRENVENAPMFNEIWSDINCYFTGDYTIVAHNASFDMSVLKCVLTDYDMQMPYFNYVCSIAFSTEACECLNIGKSLIERAKYFDIDVINHHNALDDALTCANLILKCIENKNKKSFQSYLNAYTSIPIKSFIDLYPKTTLFKSKFNSIKISEIQSTVEDIADCNDFYGKSIVLTGELSFMDRRTAMQKIVNVGGIIHNSVSKNTDYLIVGKQDKAIVGEDGLSGKEEKAYELISKGIGIKIINEDEFINLLHGVKNDDTSLDDDHMVSFGDKDEKYFSVIKEIVFKEELVPQILSIIYSNKSFSININNNIIVKVEPKPKGIDRIYFFGYQQHEKLIKIKSSKYVFLDTAEPNDICTYKDLIIKRYNYIINNYEGFGCCHLYLECSDAKKCAHKDPFVALCCYYNKNLKAGKIFYGKNANNN